ncbi:ArsR/SmtB family transcription factor [Croceitalea rosinachiae]|uniref:Metalloregulator ArsR/SmtB family transcription factor n=1 Tax=Croceitalea rosinachiae TaxID=3075596 RepID=A0ABU3AC68_9FLAO|nr:metalloregulator ArsR/SmtB family transcription factor [Croceitalea sp. F388]MDT0607780.1 metalloregulator ArsR/SmtB family transcription factor [Croceitalea sp. F388]
MRIRASITSRYINEADLKMAEIANALAHPLRVALVRYLHEKNSGKGVDNVTCNKDLVQLFDYSQSTISQHVKILKEVGLFQTENMDKFIFYHLNKELLQEFSDFLRLYP